LIFVTVKCGVFFAVRTEFLNIIYMSFAALGGLAVSVLPTGPMELSAVGSGSAKDGVFLWVIKIRSAHFLRRGSKAVVPKSQNSGM
jgi:hypothetical protein